MLGLVRAPSARGAASDVSLDAAPWPRRAPGGRRCRPAQRRRQQAQRARCCFALRCCLRAPANGGVGGQLAPAHDAAAHARALGRIRAPRTAPPRSVRNKQAASSLARRSSLRPARAAARTRAPGPPEALRCGKVWEGRAKIVSRQACLCAPWAGRPGLRCASASTVQLLTAARVTGPPAASKRAASAATRSPKFPCAIARRDPSMPGQLRARSSADRACAPALSRRAGR
jgi:hypothetical protein